MNAIELIIPSREKDLGEFSVQRILPHARRRMVGPFIFLDHMGPANFAAHQGIDVRPHPHIGLATVTYLFKGQMLHRDSLGSQQKITPGAVNWMTAGRGIAHSERTLEADTSRPHAMHGLQSWVALPREQEECEPEFFHHAADSLPEFIVNGATIRLVAGRAYGYEAPVKLYSPLFYAVVNLPAHGRLEITPDYSERALYLIEGSLCIGNDRIQPKTMPVFGRGERIVIEAHTHATFMLLGGEPFSEPRYIDWNFVSSSKERLMQAREDWKAQRFGKIPGDDTEFIPLPENR